MNKSALALLTFALFSLIVVPVSQAQLSQISCVSNTTLQITVNDTRCIDDVCKDFSRSTSEFCTYGCDSELNTCNPSPLTTNLIVMGIIILFVIVAFVVWKVVN